jgi:glycine/D-amino acid oxidase-like deaminating enzyme
MSIDSEYDAVIVGAGAIGCCTAVKLARDHDVLVLEKDSFATSASANANAYISDWWYLLQGEHVPGVTRSMRDFFQELDGTSDFEFNQAPSLVLIDEDVDMQNPENKFRKMKDSSEDIEGFSYYDRDDLEERWSDTLNLEGFVGGIVDEEGGCINPASYLEAMKTKAEELGADFKMETEVSEIITENDTAIGVAIENGSEEIHSDSVVVAAGTHSKRLVSEFVDLPVRPFVIYGNRIQPKHINTDKAPCVSGRGFLIGPDPYGYLTLVGGEYWIDDFEEMDKIPEEFPEECREHVADRLPELLKGFENEDDIEYVPGELHRCPEGITITPDQLPVIDTVGDLDNLVVADGSRGAVSMAPAIASVIGSILTGESTQIPVDRFDVDRFDFTAKYNLPLITAPPSH